MHSFTDILYHVLVVVRKYGLDEGLVSYFLQKRLDNKYEVLVACKEHENKDTIELHYMTHILRYFYEQGINERSLHKKLVNVAVVDWESSQCSVQDYIHSLSITGYLIYYDNAKTIVKEYF